MTTTNPTGYCPHCEQKVLLTREDIDMCLAIILLIFTAGIGLIIYLVIYYRRAENRCVHCGTQINVFQIEKTNQISFQQQKTQVNPYVDQTDSTYTSTTLQEVNNIFYCVFCGEKLENSNIKFCPNCGSKIEFN
ncbi:MAG: hypothetical protein ACFE9T_04450 [Promethearchaeota archaeon]